MEVDGPVGGQGTFYIPRPSPLASLDPKVLLLSLSRPRFTGPSSLSLVSFLLRGESGRRGPGVHAVHPPSHRVCGRAGFGVSGARAAPPEWRAETHGSEVSGVSAVDDDVGVTPLSP